MTLLLHAAQLLLLALFGSAPLHVDRGLATRFGDPGDQLAGGAMSCTGEKLAQTDLVCAHRTLPCGTLLVVENIRNRKFALCQVLDRGPFGALLPSGEWTVKRTVHEPGVWRGIVDLGPAVAEALEFNGRERVRLYYQPHPRRHRQPGNGTGRGN